MAKSYTFRLTAEGVAELEKQLKDLGAAGDKVFADLKQKAPGLADGVKRAGEEADAARKKLEGLGDSWSGVTRVAGMFGLAVSAAGLLNFGRDLVLAADRVADMSQALDTSIRFMSGWQAAATQMGVGAGLAESALANLNNRWGDAVRGAGAARDWFNKLGIDVVRLAEQNVNLERVVEEVAAAIERESNAAARASIAQDAFGKGIQRMMPVLEQGRQGIDAVRESTDGLSAASENSVKVLSSWWDQWEREFFSFKQASTDALAILVQLYGFRPPSDSAIEAAKHAAWLKGGNFVFPIPEVKGGPIAEVEITPGIRDAEIRNAWARELADRERAEAQFQNEIAANAKRMAEETARFLNEEYAKTLHWKEEQEENAAAAREQRQEDERAGNRETTRAYQEGLRERERAERELADQAMESAARIADYWGSVHYDIASSWRDMFGSILSEGEIDLSRLGDSARRIFTNIAFDFAASKSGFGSALGIPAGAFGGGASGGGPGGFGGLGMLGGISSGLPAWLGGTAGLSPGLSGFATSIPGLGSVNVGGTAGFATHSGMFANPGWGGALGGLGTGAMIGSALGGLGIGNATGSTIGGAIGGIAGSFIPGVGTIIGSLAGSAIGGLFGNSKPSDYTAFANFGPGLSLAGGLAGDKPNQQTIGAAQQAGQAIAEAAKLLKEAGIDLADNIVRLRIGQERSSQLELAGRQFVTVGAAGDVQAAVKGTLDYLLGTATSGNADVQRVIGSYQSRGGVTSDNIDQLLSDIGFAKALSDLSLSEEKLTASAERLKSVTEYWDGLIARAEGLGLATDNLVAQRSAAIQAVVDDFNKSIQQSFMGVTNPALAEYNALLEIHAARLKEAESIGADVNAVLALNNAELEQRAEREREVAEAMAAATAAAEARAAAEAQRAAEELAREQQILDARSASFASDIRIGILGFTDPLGAQLAAEERAAAERLATAVELGADLVEVERYNTLAREKILSDAAARIAAEAEAEAARAKAAADAEARAAEIAMRDAQELAARRVDFEKEIGIALLRTQDALAGALAAEQRAAEERLETARKLGADIAEVEKLNAVLRGDILREAAERAAAEAEAIRRQEEERAARHQAELAGAQSGLRGLVEALTMGPASALAPEQRYFAALTRFTAAERDALGAAGDPAKIAEFDIAARALLPIARDFLGTSERYGGLTAQILRSATSLGGDLADPSGMARAIVAATTAGSGAIVGELAALRAQIEVLGQELQRSNATVEALARRAS